MMLFKQLKHIAWVLPLMWLLFSGCNEESFYSGSDPVLEFSTDTLSFDTVFTTIGSATKVFMVRNNQNQPVRIQSLKLSNTESFFRINVDGVNQDEFENVEIAANDSMFIFVAVTIDPTKVNNPLFIEDSVVFELNGVQSAVKLQAYGQDVNLLKNVTLTRNTIWNSQKPYLIYDTLYVMPGVTLSIAAGTTVYSHKNTFIAVLGNIEAKGTPEKPILFRGDRLDKVLDDYKYDKISAQWYGIGIYNDAKRSLFENCEIRNAVVGLMISGLDTENPIPVVLNNTIIHNNSYASLYGLYADITARNCQITNGGTYNVLLTTGGKYNFYQCTMANYYSRDPNTRNSNKPGFILSNYINLGETQYAGDLEAANFYNCIIDGMNADEISVSHVEGYQMNFSFDHCALKVTDTQVNYYPSNYTNCFFNKEIKFLRLKSMNFDFSLDTLSAMRDQGDAELLIKHPELIYDLKGKSRLTDGKPDLGAYEFILESKKEDK